ncbi:protein kinase [Bacillus subtilis subsp. subtilis]|nr:protein kinase [Bacillus subtilis subsp. subtilis]
MLSAERWALLEALFHQASGLPGEARAAFIQARAGHDPLLWRELSAMLAVEAEATIRLRGPLHQAVSGLQHAPPPILPPGTRCGPWAVDGLIGSGGMGRVYLGHRADGAYTQQVAIKMIANPGLDARQRAFFEFECRMQAQMHHPAIVQIHDAGVHDGERPYLVMEYIDGEVIDRWCRERLASLAQRVELLRQVCQGVQHAHQKGVIHRDLKPSNVLVGEVDGRPRPKIIDFGIAFGGAAEQPDGGTRGGTPGYMSPEQTGSDTDIDARSDVYSLGAMLHELVCGQRPPARMANALSPLRALRDRDAAAQQAVAAGCGTSLRALRGALEDGLDAIVRKATEPLPGARYDGVSALLMDLERWQHNRPPLVARHQRLLVARKFLQRHRVPVAAAGLVLGCILAGLASSLWSLSKARDQQAMALHRQAQLERMVGFQQDMLQSVDVDAMGHAMLAANAEAMARTLDPVGSAAGTRVGVQVPASDIARDLLQRYVVAHALERLQHDFADDPALSADLRQSLARVLISIGRYPEAVTELRTVLAVQRAEGDSGLRLVSALADLGDALYRQGSLAEARTVLDEALRLHTPQRQPYNPLWLRVQGRQAQVMAGQGELVVALQRQQDLVQEWTPRLERDASALLEVELSIVTTLSELTRREDALARMEQVLPRIRSRYGDNAPRTLDAMLMLARLRNTFNEYERSLALATEVHARRERSLGADHPDTLRATALQAANQVRLAQAEPAFSQVEDFMGVLRSQQQRVLGANHPESMASTADLIRLLAKQSRPDKLERAIALQRGLLDQYAQIFGRLHPQTLFAQGGLASMLANTDRHDQARVAAHAALAGYLQAMPEDNRLISATWDVIGRSEARGGHLEAARDAHATALEMRMSTRGVYDAHTTESASRLYAVLQRMHADARMQEIRTRYLEPVIAQDPAALNTSQRSVRDQALRAVHGSAP